MTMDRPRRGSRRTSEQTGKDSNAPDAWRGHEPQWFKDQVQHDDQRVEMERGTGEPASGPEEHTHAEGHHWQAARSGHDEAAARGYGGPPRAAALARSRRTEVLDDDGREGGEFQARDDKDDERPRDEEQETQTRARTGSKAPGAAKMRPDGLDQAERRKMRAAGDEDEAETADEGKDRDGGESSARKRGDKATARDQVTKAARKPVRKAAPKRAAAVRKSAPKRATKAAGTKRKVVATSTRAGAAKARTAKARTVKKAAPSRATAGKAKRKTKAPAARRSTKMARKR